VSDRRCFARAGDWLVIEMEVGRPNLGWTRSKPKLDPNCFGLERYPIEHQELMFVNNFRALTIFPKFSKYFLKVIPLKYN
jgi:hypothetical protein